jgi:hypothetical protein
MNTTWAPGKIKQTIPARAAEKSMQEAGLNNDV